MSDTQHGTATATWPRNTVAHLLPLGLFVLLLVVLVVGLVHAPEKDMIPSPLIGKAAPQFSMPNLTAGRGPVSTEQLKGHWSLVNVWGSWCVTCRDEHPTLLMIKQQGRYPSSASTGTTTRPMRSDGCSSSATPTLRSARTTTAASPSTGVSTALPRASWSIRRA